MLMLYFVPETAQAELKKYTSFSPCRHRGQHGHPPQHQPPPDLLVVAAQVGFESKT